MNSALLRYTLLQIPGLVLLGALLWWAWSEGWLSPLAALLVFVVWLVKDVMLYPFYRPALERQVPTGGQVLIGREGFVTVPLDPVGRVRIGGESWRAHTPDRQPLPRGQPVRVVAARGVTLQVMPLDNDLETL
ncbi:MAG: NfeD family protein [Ectothiorhodospiraceae bacterium]|nr:NfeD family protein [Ectothiorhodospiraceae bacterium]MCH8503230.1 NfeD family protein [Ectothiorhodospiraceae bacterium]